VEVLGWDEGWKGVGVMYNTGCFRSRVFMRIGTRGLRGV